MVQRQQVTTGLWEAALLCGGCLTAIMSTLLSPALSEIKEDYPDASPTTVKLVLTLPSLLLAVCAPLTGLMLSCGVPHRPILIVSVVCIAVFGVLPFFITDLTWIIVVRGLFGVFVGSAEATSTTLLTVLEPQMDERLRKRSVLYGCRAGIMSFTGFTCSLVGGALANDDWRNIFWIHVVSLVYIVGYVVIPTKEPQPRPTEVQEDTKDNKVFGIVCVLIAAFYTQLFFYALPTNISFYVSESLAIDDAFLSGLMSGASVCASGLVSLVYPFVLKGIKRPLERAGCDVSVPHFIVLAIAVIPMAIGFIVLVYSQDYWLSWVFSTLLVGGFNGLNMPNCNVWASQVASQKWVGTMIGSVTSLTFLAHFITPFVLDYLPYGEHDQTRVGFFMCAMMLFLCGLLAIVAFTVLLCKKR